LTRRETEVLSRVARGETDQQIADKLYLSRKTVSNHVSNILDKLDVANRKDAVVTGFRLGLLWGRGCRRPNEDLKEDVMIIDRGPLLMMAASQKQQQQLADAERSRRIGNAQRTNAGHLERHSVGISSRVIGGHNAMKGWLSVLARDRATLVPSLEK
jgi:DNA-binding CsgD family transcriptional regulator